MLQYFEIGFVLKKKITKMVNRTKKKSVSFAFKILCRSAKILREPAPSVGNH